MSSMEEQTLLGLRLWDAAPAISSTFRKTVFIVSMISAQPLRARADVREWPGGSDRRDGCFAILMRRNRTRGFCLHYMDTAAPASATVAAPNREWPGGLGL